VEAFPDNNNEYQLRDFKAVMEPTDKLYCNDTNNEIRVLREIVNRLPIMSAAMGDRAQRKSVS
jgi:hypothetical protein